MAKVRSKPKGVAAPQYSKEDKVRLAESICSLYESQGCTLESACQSVGISDRLFRYWAASNSEISDLYKKAKAKSIEIYWDRLRDKAQTGLELLVEGTTYTERKEESGVGATGVISKTTETEVRVLPNPTSVIFALKGEFPDRFSDRSKVQSTVNLVDGLDAVPLENRLAALAALESTGNGAKSKRNK